MVTEDLPSPLLFSWTTSVFVLVSFDLHQECKSSFAFVFVSSQMLREREGRKIRRIVVALVGVCF